MRRLKTSVPILIGLVLLTLFGLFLPETDSTGVSYAAAVVIGLLFSFEIVRLLRTRSWKVRFLYPGLVVGVTGLLMNLTRDVFLSTAPMSYIGRHLAVILVVIVWFGMLMHGFREFWEHPSGKRRWIMWLSVVLLAVAVVFGTDPVFAFFAGLVLFSVGLSWRRLRNLRPSTLIIIVIAAFLASVLPFLDESIGAKLLLPGIPDNETSSVAIRLATTVIESSRVLLRAFGICLVIFGVWHWTAEILFGRGRVRAKLLGSYMLTAIVPLLFFTLIFGLGTYLLSVTYRSTLTRKLLVAEERNFEKWATSLSLRKAFWESLAQEKTVEKHLPLAMLDLYPDATFDVLQLLQSRDKTSLYLRQGAKNDTVVVPSAMEKGGVCFALHNDELCMFAVLTTKPYLLRAWVPASKEFLKRIKQLSGTDIEFRLDYRFTVSHSDTFGTANLSASLGEGDGLKIEVEDSILGRNKEDKLNKSSTVDLSVEKKDFLDTRIPAGLNAIRGADWKTGGEVRIPYLLTFTPRMIYQDLFNPDERINQAFRAAFYFLGSVFLIVMIFISWLGWRVAAGLNRSAKMLEKGVQELRSGHLAYEMPVEGGAEFRQVAESFNMLTRDIRRMLRDLSEKERIEGELSVARSIQQALLPQHLPVLHQIQIAARNEPAREVGGDYYDIIELENGSILLALGDVSGKGIASALVMARVQSLLRTLARKEQTLPDLMSALNRGVCDGAHPGMFVSLFVGLLDPKTKTLDYINGGHDFPILCKAGKVDSLQTGGLILGVFPEAEYVQDRVCLTEHSCLLLYTDGISETKNSAEREFGVDNLVSVLHTNGNAYISAEQLLNNIFARAEEHSEGRPADDDRTAIVLVFS